MTVNSAWQLISLCINTNQKKKKKSCVRKFKYSGVFCLFAAIVRMSVMIMDTGKKLRNISKTGKITQTFQ